MGVRLKPGRAVLMLYAVLAAVTLLWNVACGILWQIHTVTKQKHTLPADSEQALAFYQAYADILEENVSVHAHRDRVESFFSSGMSQITEAEPIRHSMLMGYHESIVSVPGEEGLQTEKERYPYVMAVFYVTCHEASEAGRIASGYARPENAKAVQYDYRVSVEQAVRLDPSYGEVKALKISSAVNKEESAPLMEVGKQYLVWGKCIILADGTYELVLTDHKLLDQDRTLKVQGDTVVYEATGRMPVCSEIGGTLEEFYKTENGRLWHESVFRLCDVSYRSLRVLGVESMQYLVPLRNREMTLKEGRMLTLTDHEEKNRVCLISDEAARINGWSLGDTVSLSFYQADYSTGDFDTSPQPDCYDPYRDFREEGEYEIVGIYHTEDWAGNEYGIHPATVLIPKNSLKNKYYQDICAALVFTCSPDHLEILQGELEDLYLLRHFRFIDVSGADGSQDETVWGSGSVLSVTWLAGNIVLCVCWLVLLGCSVLWHIRRYGCQRLLVNIRDIFPYVGKRLRREPWSGTFSALLVVLVAFLILTMQNRLAYQQSEMEATYDKYPIECAVSNASGTQTDYLNIPPRIYELCTEGDGRLFSYVKELRLLTRLTTAGRYRQIVAEDGTVSETMEKDVEIIGINCLAADERIYANSVEFSEGYSEADLAGDALVCLVPRSVEDTPVTIDFQVNLHTRVTLKVIGTYSPTRTRQIFCPFGTICQWNEEMGRLPHAERLCFMVADTRELNACKQELSRYFIEIDRNVTAANEDKLAIIMDDALFTESSYVLQRSMLLFRVMLIALCILSVGISFLAAFLAIRGRKTELAVMCSLGKGRVAVYMTVLLEHLVFFAVGMLLALILHRAVFGALPSLFYLLIFLLCYAAGVTIAILQATGGKIMQVLKGNE